MRKFLLMIFPIFLLVANSKISAQEIVQSLDKSWIGKYRYSFSERGNSGYSDVTKYTLTISQKGDGVDCHFVAEGPQMSNADYQCRAEAKDNKLTFYFVRSLETMGDGQVERMKSNYVIGSLVKITARGKVRYRLEGGRYQFAMISTTARPVYFKKVN